MNKKNSKRFLALILLLTVCCTCSACGNSTDTDTNADRKVQNEAKAAAKDQNISLFMSELITLEKADSFTSANPEIASVDGNGSLHACKAGTTNVSAKTGNTLVTYNVTVKKRGMVYPSFSMMTGEKLCIQFSSKDSGQSYTSNQPAIATVSKKGRIKAKKEGNAVITVKSKNHTYTCNLTVTKKINSVVYLTFDDGPNRYSTPKILDILKNNNIKATFFELKPAKKDYDLTERVIKEGHTLALHGYQHKYDKIYKSKTIYRKNLDQLRDLFFKKFGVWCTISRFPGGSSNMVSRYNPGIMTKLSKSLDGWGYHYFDWNISSCDAGGAKNAKQVYHVVKKTLLKGHENVVLMHDFANNDKTINALDKIIKWGKNHGFTFRALSASTTEIHHRVSN